MSKSSRIAETLGLLDELNSFVGLCKVKSDLSACLPERVRSQTGGDAQAEKAESLNGVAIKDMLEDVQQNLFIVQAEVAGNKEKKIGPEKIKKIEEIIAAVEKEIPPIKSFILAGGTELSALLDVARAIARRAERTVIGVCDSGEREICEDARAYLNRLSSFLFALARFVNFKRGVKEKSPTYK